MGIWLLKWGAKGSKRKVAEKVAETIVKVTPQVEKTGTKEVIEHFKKAVKGLEPQHKASIYKTHVAPYVKKWSGKKGDKPSKKKD